MKGGDDRAETLASAWAAQTSLPKIDRQLVERALPDGRAQIGDYEVLRVLGEGEFATVYECRRMGDDDDDDAQILACKAIKKAKVERHSSGSILKAKRNINRVSLELDAMGRLRHAGICRLYDALQSSTYVYCFLEAGERDLFSFLDDHPRGCAPDVCICVARIAALALRHCHNAGVAHRDVKPENVLVVGQPADWVRDADQGIVKLCDFGLCADISNGEALTDFVGSPGFFAPELFTEPSYRGDVADAWSLGAVTVELLVGHRAFDLAWCPPYDELRDPEKFASGARGPRGKQKTPFETFPTARSTTFDGSRRRRGDDEDRSRTGPRRRRGALGISARRAPRRGRDPPSTAAPPWRRRGESTGAPRRSRRPRAASSWAARRRSRRRSPNYSTDCCASTPNTARRSPTSAGPTAST